MSFSLIVPLAGYNPVIDKELPHVFEVGSHGTYLCVDAIRGLNLEAFDKVIYVLLAEFENLHHVKDQLKNQLDTLALRSADVVLLPHPTRSQPETIYQTIIKCGITGSIFVKDPDGFFKAEIYPYNGVTTYPLENMSLVDPKNKSYVAVDDMYCITNIIEKKVIGNLFNAGGYVFEDAQQYCRYYKALEHHKRLFLSHIIYSMLLDKAIFRPIPVTDYEDWGTRWLLTLKNLKQNLF